MSPKRILPFCRKPIAAKPAKADATWRLLADLFGDAEATRVTSIVKRKPRKRK